MDIEEIKKSINFNEDIALPTLCIAVFAGQIIFTTKKVGSRYFEDITRTESPSKSVSTIEFKILRVDDNTLKNLDFDSRLLFDKYYFELSPNSFLSIDAFFKKLKIEKISDIVSDNVLMEWQLVCVVREPVKRTLTAFVEVCDSYVGSSMVNVFSKHIFQKYFKLIIPPSENYNFKNLTTENINNILNEYALHTGPDLIKDEHASGWHMFLTKFIKTYRLDGKVKIVNLDDKEDMSVFPIIAQPSNKSHLNNWIIEENKFYLNTFLKSIESFLIQESDAYNELLELKH